MANIVVIPAAGSGSRMRAGVNKQYLLLDERPILAHTVEVFAHHPRIDRIYLVVPPNELTFCRDTIVATYHLERVAAVLAGGAERQDSVYNGLCGCDASDDDLVLIHDGARPFLDAALIDAVLDAAQISGACAVGVPVKDTIKRVVDGVAIETPDRRELWQVQTPQGFRYGLLYKAHELARRDGFYGTDDAMLVERLGWPVTMVLGSYRNLKITTPEDLIIARALLAAQGETP